MRLFITVLILCTSLIHSAAYASCGSATCSLASHLDTLGLTTSTGWKLDLRYEYIKQGQLRSGTDKVEPEFVDGEHTEISTENNNYSLTLDYSLDSHWGLSLQLPYVSRKHDHIFVDGPDQEEETWDFNELGDMRVVGRYILSTDEDKQNPFGIQMGLKLPTGKTDVANDAGEVAERSLQPGSGTTDFIIGVFHTQNLNWFDIEERGFIQAQLQTAIKQYDGFSPGDHFHVDAGLVFTPVADLNAILQLNFLAKGRDQGVNAEPEDSGGKYLWLSPGLSLSLGHRFRLYGYLQYPLLQDVNGTQLTSDWTASVGITWL